MRLPRGKEAAKLLAMEEDRDRVTHDNEGGSGVAAPAGWQDWRCWVDWSDWRVWSQRVGSADWARGQWASAPWAQSLDALDPDSIQIRLGTP